MKNLAFRIFTQMKDDYTTNYNYPVIHFTSKDSDNVLFELTEITESPSRVINFKLPLQFHQKYYITQYGERSFS